MKIDRMGFPISNGDCRRLLQVGVLNHTASGITGSLAVLDLVDNVLSLFKFGHGH